MHEFMSIPTTDVSFKLKGTEVELILSTLTKVHTSLVETLTDPKTSGEDRQAAYEYALSTEYLYASIFRQLKLYKPERADLN